MANTEKSSRHRRRLGFIGLAAALLASPSQAAARQDEVQIDRPLEELNRTEWTGRPTARELGSEPPNTDALALTKDGGWLFTPTTYYDFILDYEMRLEPRGRHRLFFRTLSLTGESYELRMEPDGRGVKAEVRANRTLFSTNQRVSIPRDRLRAAFDGREWHTLRVHAQDARVVITANGIPLLDLDGVHLLGGRIGFGGEGVTFRAARVRARPDPEPFRSAYGREEALEMPAVVKEVRPIMPAKAYASPRDYVVMLEVVIDENGDVVAERFLRRFDEDLGYNEEAVRVVRQWKFKPGRVDGKPVPVLATIELTFTWKQ